MSLEKLCLKATIVQHCRNAWQATIQQGDLTEARFQDMLLKLLNGIVPHAEAPCIHVATYLPYGTRRSETSAAWQFRSTKELHKCAHSMDG
eukprot:scaffold16916_cov16-Tisochrysis_lutea.AAC.1